MNTAQAKIILSAHRPGRDDEIADEDQLPDLETALACLETDPDLALWFAHQATTDEIMREALRTITPPDDLRNRILAEAKVTRFPKFSGPQFWLAAAACVLLGLSAFLLFPRQSQLSPTSLVAQIPALNARHDHTLAVSPDALGEIRSWLAKNDAASDFILPKGLADLQGIACEVASIDGTQVTILCFHINDKRIAHLYVVDRSRLKNPLDSSDPAFLQIGDTAIATWSAGSHSYFLSESGDSKDLERLL
jgi:hypothetical protein